jgi:hypothetical protein
MSNFQMKKYFNYSKKQVVLTKKLKFPIGMRCNALTKALMYVEQQPNVTANDILLIKRWKYIATNNLWKSKTKQLTIQLDSSIQYRPVSYRTASFSYREVPCRTLPRSTGRTSSLSPRTPSYAERAILMKHINKANITFVANKHGVVINWTAFNS